MEIRRLAPGDRILDYRILERLGEGGFGEVFRAEHEVLGKIVAIKVPRDQSGLTALRHEGVVQSSLNHPYIVNTLELSISHDPPFVVMEYVEGESLADVLKREGSLPWRRAARILLEAGRALAHAHSKGVIHGDVKPGNLLIGYGRDGQVFLTDFGLGRVFEGPQGNLQISRSLELATSGAEVQGTIRYLAPEVLRGEQADERADIYSFAVLMFETVTGRLPEGREVPSDLTKNLPPEFDQIFAQNFTRRERRPRSFDSTLKALEGLLQDKPAKKTEEPKAVQAIPADRPKCSADRHREEEEEEETPWSVRMAEVRSLSGFPRWREAFLSQLQRRIGGQRGITASDGNGFDLCFGVTGDGEPHHRVYCLLIPKLDPQTARAAVAEARRIFDLEKGIWEKEVTFWVIAQEVDDHDQVLWTLKSFSMGWWRRRRIVLQDVAADRLYAAELGCDPRGNPLKRAFMAASQETIKVLPPEPQPMLVCAAPRRSIRGTAWGAALALLMTFGLLGSIMALEIASRKMRACDLEDGPTQPATIVNEVQDDESTPVAVDPTPPAVIAPPVVETTEPEGLAGVEPEDLTELETEVEAPATSQRDPEPFLPSEPEQPKLPEYH